MSRILIVDDNPDIIEALDLLLTLHGHQVVKAFNKMDAVLAVSRQSIDLVIQDMNFAFSATSGEEGRSLFHEFRKLKPNLPIIVITAWSQLENAVELVKAGAVDYLQKPWDDAKLIATIAEHCKIEPATSNSTAQPRSNMIYRSQIMHELVNSAEKVASADINVLITGANGAGKEKLADHLHQRSNRAQSPFVKVNMGALPQELMEAELFGAERGAYTGANERRQGRFETADGGTLFLDEIGNLSQSGQMKLLRVLQTGEFERLGSSTTQKVDVRVISATNADLKADVANGAFREDLFYRLNVVQLHLPALHERKDDIIPLAEHFLGQDFQLSESAKSALMQHPWPGNVRELENACARAKVFSRSALLEAEDLFAGTAPSNLSEKDRIEQALTNHNGVIKHAAAELGMSRQSLYRRIEKYQLDVTEG